MSKKDYSKLRPFDLEAARDRGELLTGSNPHFEGKPVWKYAAGPDALGKIIATDLTEGIFTNPANTDGLRMAPLAWVRKSADEDVLWPVYKGDIIYSSFFKSTFEVTGARDGNNRDIGETDTLLKAEKRLSTSETFANSCTFTPPKVKREGWGVINKSALCFPTQEDAEYYRNRLNDPDRFVTVKAKWEEPAVQEGGA